MRTLRWTLPTLLAAAIVTVMCSAVSAYATDYCVYNVDVGSVKVVPPVPDGGVICPDCPGGPCPGPVGTLFQAVIRNLRTAADAGNERKIANPITRREK